jgi:hypothetical protein
MTISNRLKRKFVSLTLTLAFTVALATSAAAEDGAPQPSNDAKATNFGAHSPDSLPVGNNSAPASGGAKTEDIDTRITVQPHGPPGGQPGRVGGAPNSIVPLKLINPHRRTFSPSRAANRFAPNASRVPAPQRQRPAVGATGGGGGGIGLAKPGSTLAHQQALQPASISPAGGGSKTLIHGGIGGASVNHHGTGTAGIGGPARTVTGINGTSIRETH